MVVVILIILFYIAIFIILSILAIRIIKSLIKFGIDYNNKSKDTEDNH